MVLLGIRTCRQNRLQSMNASIILQTQIVQLMTLQGVSIQESSKSVPGLPHPSSDLGSLLGGQATLRQCVLHMQPPDQSNKVIHLLGAHGNPTEFGNSLARPIERWHSFTRLSTSCVHLVHFHTILVGRMQHGNSIVPDLRAEASGAKG